MAGKTGKLGTSHCGAITRKEFTATVYHVNRVPQMIVNKLASMVGDYYTAYEKCSEISK
jgi:hypothetical protein